MKCVAKFLTQLSVFWIVLLLIAEFLVAERNPFAAAMTYIPQQPLILPVVSSLAVCIFVRRWGLVMVNMLLIAVFSTFLLGFNVGLSGNRDGHLRVMTINVARSTGKLDLLTDIIGRENPDVVFLQEANPLRADKDVLQRIVHSRQSDGDAWQVARIADVAIISQHPLRQIRSTILLPGSGRRMLVAEIEIAGRTTTLACVHFTTNTAGATRDRTVDYLCGAAIARTTQTRRLLAALPAECTIIAGDFNTPPRGLAYGCIALNYADTFSSGAGFGYTYPANLPLIRIDHVFASKDLIPVRWRVIDTGASDHRAVIVDFRYLGISFRDD